MVTKSQKKKKLTSDSVVTLNLLANSSIEISVGTTVWPKHKNKVQYIHLNKHIC